MDGYADEAGGMAIVLLGCSQEMKLSIEHSPSYSSLVLLRNSCWEGDIAMEGLLRLSWEPWAGLRGLVKRDGWARLAPTLSQYDTGLESSPSNSSLNLLSFRRRGAGIKLLLPPISE